MYRIKIFVISLIALTLFACSTTGRIEELIVSPDEVKGLNHHNGNVRIEVIGGDRLFVSSDIFKSALTENLKKLNVFSSAGDMKDSEYELFVIILRSENFDIGSNLLMKSKWILKKNGTEILNESVTGNGHSSNFSGAARIRASNESASKDTIQKGIEIIGSLAL